MKIINPNEKEVGKCERLMNLSNSKIISPKCLI